MLAGEVTAEDQKVAESMLGELEALMKPEPSSSATKPEDRSVQHMSSGFGRFPENRVGMTYTVGCEFASRPGHTKDHHKNDTNYLPAWHLGISAARLFKRPGNVCGTVYGDMHLNDLLGLIARVGYLILVLC